MECGAILKNWTCNLFIWNKQVKTLFALSILCLTFSLAGCGGPEPGESHSKDNTPGGEPTATIPTDADAVQDMEPGSDPGGN